MNKKFKSNFLFDNKNYTMNFTIVDQDLLVNLFLGLKNKETQTIKVIPVLCYLQGNTFCMEI